MKSCSINSTNGLHIQIKFISNNNNYKIKLFWISGHFNIKENELAKLAAKSAIIYLLSSLTQIILFRDIQMLISVSVITNKCQLRWHQKWTSYSTKLNHIKYKTSTILSYHHKRFNRTHLNLSQFLKAVEEPPICTACYGIHVTIKHILTES